MPSGVAETSSGTRIDSSSPSSVNAEVRERDNDDGQSIQPNVSTMFCSTIAVSSSNLESEDTDMVSENSNDGMEIEPSNGIGTLSQKTSCNNNNPHRSGNDRGEIIRHSDDRTSTTTKSYMSVIETSRASFSELLTTEDNIREKQSATTQTVAANIVFTLPPSVNIVLPYRIPQKWFPPKWKTSAKSQYGHKTNKWHGIHWSMLPDTILEHPRRDSFQQPEPDEQQRCKNLQWTRHLWVGSCCQKTYRLRRTRNCDSETSTEIYGFSRTRKHVLLATSYTERVPKTTRKRMASMVNHECRKSG